MLMFLPSYLSTRSLKYRKTLISFNAYYYGAYSIMHYTSILYLLYLLLCYNLEKKVGLVVALFSPVYNTLTPAQKCVTKL